MGQKGAFFKTCKLLGGNKDMLGQSKWWPHHGHYLWKWCKKWLKPNLLRQPTNSLKVWKYSFFDHTIAKLYEGFISLKSFIRMRDYLKSMIFPTLWGRWMTNFIRCPICCIHLPAWVCTTTIVMRPYQAWYWSHRIELLNFEVTKACYVNHSQRNWNVESVQLIPILLIWNGSLVFLVY